MFRKSEGTSFSLKFFGLVVFLSTVAVTFFQRTETPATVTLPLTICRTPVEGLNVGGLQVGQKLTSVKQELASGWTLHKKADYPQGYAVTGEGTTIHLETVQPSPSEEVITTLSFGPEVGLSYGNRLILPRVDFPAVEQLSPETLNVQSDSTMVSCVDVRDRRAAYLTVLRGSVRWVNLNWSD